VGAKVVSRLPDQVEAKIARANRAFRVSSRIIAAAQQDLENHGEWLDRHRATWAEEVERHRRLLNRKLALRAVGRFAASLVFAAPFALARAIERRLEPRAPQERRPSDAEPPFTREAALQLRIRRIGEPSGATAPDAPSTCPERVEEPKVRAPLSTGSAPLAPAANARSRADRVPTPAIGALAVLIVAAGVLRAIFSGPSTEETARVAREAANPESPAAATLTVVKSKRKTEPPAWHSGFAVLEAAPSIEGLRTRPQTIAEMMAMAESLPSSSVATEAAPRPLAEEPVAPKPAAKAKPRRKVAAREPDPLPWWQQWSWIRVR
jgi:hypothetical protein